MTEPEPRRTEHREAFWTLLVGMPAAFSVLRLWVESGGELQITLLLVSNVGTLNLGAALLATITQLVTVVLISLFTAGGILRAAVAAAPEGSRLRAHTPLVARISAAAPAWFVVVTFVFALLTWKIVYLPLLVPAAVAVFQRPPWRVHDRWQVGLGLYLVALAGYGWLIGPAVGDAWSSGEPALVALLVLPPLVAFGMAGPVPGSFARMFAVLSQLAIVGVAVLAAQQAVQTPVLPLVVVETQGAEGTEFVRGHPVAVDDLYLVILEEKGGVRYLPTGAVESMVLCGTPAELPAFTTRVRDYHVEDSLLSAAGRQVRPRVRVDPICRITDPSVLTRS